MAVRCSVSFIIAGSDKVSLDLHSNTSAFKYGPPVEVLSSTDISKHWSDTRTVATTETLDLTALVNAVRGTQVFASLKLLYIRNKHASGTLTIGGGSDAILANTETIEAGGWVVKRINKTVNSGAKNLVLAGTAVPYDIVLIGN